MTGPVEIPLSPDQFGPVERTFAKAGGIVVNGFRYRSGVAALRILNGAGEVIVLPFQGQQVWDATFLGRRLTMGSAFDEPQDTADFLSNYGGLLLHCGAAAMGNPGLDDSHPLHGELPNARYDNALIQLESLDGAMSVTLTGTTRHTRAFGHSYDATASLRIRQGSTRISVRMRIQNRQQRPMNLLYLAHVNFRPADGGRFIDTAQDGDILIRNTSKPALNASLAERDAAAWTAPQASALRDVPASGSMSVESVAVLRPVPGPNGQTHAAQMHPDGTADFVTWRTSELPLAVRWIIRNGDEDAAGFMMPSTAYPDGLAAAGRRGQLVCLPPGKTMDFAYEFGAVDAAAAAALAAEITAIGRPIRPRQTMTGTTQ